MNLPKQLALTGYGCATAPQRWLLRRRLQQVQKVPVSIVFYHRVADTCPNDWTLSRAQFRKQVNWIRDRFEIVSLFEAQRRLARGNRTPTVCLTFDDGYADNCDWALPWLIQEELPCTYFVASGHVLSRKPFAHDLQAGTPLSPNTVDQIRSLAHAGVEIGAHTRTHADLGRITDPRQMEEEVLGSAEDVTRITSLPARYFAFPIGQHAHLTSNVFNLLRNTGFLGACSAYGGHNFPTPCDEDKVDLADPIRSTFHLQRIHGDPQLAPVKNWLTLDPRKLHVPEYPISWSSKSADSESAAMAETVMS